MKYDEEISSIGIFIITIFTIVILIAFIFLCMYLYPKYNIYSQRLKGQSLLEHAKYSKEVSVAEAKAKMESADFLSKAEIKRAQGVAEANKIIGESLKNNESYLRYLWITETANNNSGKTVVYVPTETNLPILESTRHKGN